MRFHHVGVVVAEIEVGGRSSMEQLGLRSLTPIYADPLQRVRVQFWGREGDESCVELVEPDGAGSPVARFLSKGGGLHHLCFEVDDLEIARTDAVANGAICVCAPVPAVAFSGRSIAFFFFRNLGLVELVQGPG